MLFDRFDPEEPITHGVETLNHCEINVDVAVTGNDTWTLQTDEEARAKMGGKHAKLLFQLCLKVFYTLKYFFNSTNS